MRFTLSAIAAFAATAVAAQDEYWVMACSEPNYKGTCVNTTAPADTCSLFPDDTPAAWSFIAGWKWTGVFYNSTGSGPEFCDGLSINVDETDAMADMTGYETGGMVPVKWRADSGAGD